MAEEIDDESDEEIERLLDNKDAPSTKDKPLVKFYVSKKKKDDPKYKVEVFDKD